MNFSFDKAAARNLFKKIEPFFGKEILVLSIIFTLALALRLLHVFYLWDTPPQLPSDALEYHMYAVNMAKGLSFADSYGVATTYRGPVAAQIGLNFF